MLFYGQKKTGKTEPFPKSRKKSPKTKERYKMLSSKEIKERLNEHKEELYKKYRIKEIGIFGSFVRNEQKKRSDLDILVEFEEVPDLLRFIEIERYLGRLLRKKVDLVEKTSIRPQLEEIILKEVVYI
jgi:predicted nucleotidyltransferase